MRVFAVSWLTPGAADDGITENAGEERTALEAYPSPAEAFQVKRYGNLLYVVTVNTLPKEIDGLRGIFGMFFEYEAAALDELAGHITKKVQTAAVCGVEREEMTEFIRRNHLQGIDRITAFGQTLDMGIVWDGYDIIGDLSRIIG